VYISENRIVNIPFTLIITTMKTYLVTFGTKDIGLQRKLRDLFIAELSATDTKIENPTLVRLDNRFESADEIRNIIRALIDKIDVECSFTVASCVPKNLRN